MASKESFRIQQTKDYGNFVRHSRDNRPFRPEEHKELHRSMERYGFLPYFPVVVEVLPNGKYAIIEGQHRFHNAQQDSLPVWFVIIADEHKGFDIAQINSAAKVWKIRDYAERYAGHGKQAYLDVLAFQQRHNVPIGTCFALLAGVTSYSFVKSRVQSGEYKVKDADWAEAVVAIYAPLADLARPRGIKLRKSAFIDACMGICRVEEFSADRLIRAAKRCPEKLQNFGTREAFLAMLEDIYNFACRSPVPLKIMACQVMKERFGGKKKEPVAG